MAHNCENPAATNSGAPKDNSTAFMIPPGLADERSLALIARKCGIKRAALAVATDSVLVVSGKRSDVALFEFAIDEKNAKVAASRLQALVDDKDRVAPAFDITSQPIGFLASALFKKKKDDAEGESTGGFMVEAARKAVDQVGPIAIDNTGALWTYDRGVYVLGDDVVRDRLYRMLGDRFTTGHLTNVRKGVESTAPKLDLAMPPNPEVMNFRNGVLDWRRSDGVVDHDPAVLSTTQFPYDWDASAKCPRFDQWLETMLEPEQVTLAWKILGYMMLSGNPLQVAFMIYGKGSNGKGTFTRVVGRLVGRENTSAVPLKDLGVRFQTTGMLGKIANIVGDIDSEYQAATAALKQITGGDDLQFERKNKDSFRAYLWTTCLFSANKIPGTNDRSDGYEERWVPLHFKRKASEHRIAGFNEEALWRELPGIAAKAVRALRTLPLEQGSDRAKAFDLTSASAREAVEEFRQASNSYYDWIKTHTVPSEDEIIKPKELWAAFKIGTGAKVGGTNCPRDFKEALEARYGPLKKRRGFHALSQRQQNFDAFPAKFVDGDESTTDDTFFGIVGQEQAS